MKNKLIVDRNQAKKIRDNDTCQICVNMRIQEGVSKHKLAIKKFLNQVLWVAEPLCTIQCGPEKYAKHFSCDPLPTDWYRKTLDRAGSRVQYGEHRHLVECIDVQVAQNSAGQLFSVFLTLKKSPLQAPYEDLNNHA